MSQGPIKSSEQRVGVFVDVQNMFYSAKALHQSKIDYSKLLQEIVGSRNLIRAIAYVVQKPEVDQSSFTDALERLGYEIKSKDLRLRPDGTAKGDWDMGIAIDTIAIAPKLDTVVLVSGDGDFVPLVEMLKAHGLTDVEMDAEGNVMGLRRGTGPAGGKVVVLAAHLDTVFPEGTPIKVRREGTKLHAPGVGDDTHSLAVLLAYVRALDAAKIRTKRDILFVGNVGEEGPGDLRGVRYLFTKGKYKDRIGAFFSMDGTSAERVTFGAVGSRRYRVTFKGPGGHSYGAYGVVNPMAAMGTTVVEMNRITTPAKPKTTYATSVVGGGTSVNSIPDAIWDAVPTATQDNLPAYLSTSKGKLTITAPSTAGQRRLRIGFVSVGGSGAVRLAISIGEPADL